MSYPTSPFKTFLNPGSDSYQGGKSKEDVRAAGKVYKLSSNENLLGASPKAMAAVKANLNHLNEYPDRTDRRLRSALSGFYERALSPEQFVTANSGVGILQMIVHAFLAEGLECIYSNPAFKPYSDFSAQVGARSIDVPLVGDEFRLDVQGILKAITNRTRIIWLCSPNNPTGTHLPRPVVQELLDSVPEHVIVVYDEVYYQFATAPDYTTALPFILEGKNVIAVNSFSKAYGLAGMRIGYAYSTPEVAEYLRLVSRPFLLNTLGLEAAIAALEDADFIRQTVEMINRGKAYLYPELDRLDIKYWRGQGNFFLLRPDMPDREFEEKMLARGVMVRPVAAFGAPGCIRVTIGTQEANEAFIHALEGII